MDYANIMNEAVKAAEAASEAWVNKWFEARGLVRDGLSSGGLANRMMDCCGNAHSVIRDKRTKVYKDLNKLGYMDGDVIRFVSNYPLRRYQDWGIHEAAISAANAVLNSYGIPARMWSYID